MGESNQELSEVYESLPAEFKGRASQKGWEFKMLEREGLVALYEKRTKDVSRPYYEVVVIGRRKAMTKIINGVTAFFKAAETYPSDSAFGVEGWSYGDLSLAQAKFRAVVEARRGGEIEVVEGIEEQEGDDEE